MQAETKVVFRKYSKKEGGDIIALFPETDAHGNGRYCDCYQHIGQHGAANYRMVVQNTKPATQEEYASLKSELEASPYHYRLKVIRRYTKP